MSSLSSFLDTLNHHSSILRGASKKTPFSGSRSKVIHKTIECQSRNKKRISVPPKIIKEAADLMMKTQSPRQDHTEEIMQSIPIKLSNADLDIGNCNEGSSTFHEKASTRYTEPSNRSTEGNILPIIQKSSILPPSESPPPRIEWAIPQTEEHPLTIQAPPNLSVLIALQKAVSQSPIAKRQSCKTLPHPNLIPSPPKASKKKYIELDGKKYLIPKKKIILHRKLSNIKAEKDLKCVKEKLCNSTDSIPREHFQTMDDRPVGMMRTLSSICDSSPKCNPLIQIDNWKQMCQSINGLLDQRLTSGSAGEAKLDPIPKKEMDHRLQLLEAKIIKPKAFTRVFLRNKKAFP